MPYVLSWPAGTLTGREFYAGDLAIVTDRNAVFYEIVEIESVTDSTITLVNQPVQIWQPDSRIIPLRVAHIEQLPARSFVTSKVASVAVRFELDEPERNIVPTWGSTGAVWPFKSNWASGVETGYDRLVYVQDVATGLVETTDPADVGRVTQRAQVSLFGRDKVRRFRSFIAMARGQAVRFWKDSGTHDIEPLGVIGGGVTLDIAEMGYYEWFKVPQDGRLAIAIFFLDGSEPIYVGIDAVEKRDGFDRLVLHEAIPELNRRDIDRISYLMPVRFAQDVFEIEHLTDNLSAVRASVAVRSSRVVDMPDSFGGAIDIPTDRVVPTPILLDTFTAADGTDPTTRDMDVYIAGATRWEQSGASPVGDIQGNAFGPSGTSGGAWTNALITYALPSAAPVMGNVYPFAVVLRGVRRYANSCRAYAYIDGPGYDAIDLLWTTDTLQAELTADNGSGGWNDVTVSYSLPQGDGALHNFALWADGTTLHLLLNGVDVGQQSYSIGDVLPNRLDLEITGSGTPDSEPRDQIASFGYYQGLTLSQAISLTA